MKKTDLAMIVLIAAVSVIVAFFATQAVLGGQANEAVEVDTIEKISGEISEPDPNIFNSGNINPAVEVQINSGSQ